MCVCVCVCVCMCTCMCACVLHVDVCSCVLHCVCACVLHVDVCVCALCENYQAAGRSFAPEAGEPITEIAQVVFQEEDPGLLFLRILDFEGNWHGIHLNVRQEREG